MRAWFKKYRDQGHLAEFLVSWLLRLKGYRILKHRYKTPLGEIDLIATRGKTLVAVEVKQRITRERAGESITLKQRKRIENALALYMRQLRWTPENVRFDAVLLASYKWPRHIPHAWRMES